ACDVAGAGLAAAGRPPGTPGAVAARALRGTRAAAGAPPGPEARLLSGGRASRLEARAGDGRRRAPCTAQPSRALALAARPHLPRGARVPAPLMSVARAAPPGLEPRPIRPAPGHAYRLLHQKIAERAALRGVRPARMFARA